LARQPQRLFSQLDTLCRNLGTAIDNLVQAVGLKAA
jgi:hypothetical protein